MVGARRVNLVPNLRACPQKEAVLREPSGTGALEREE